MKLIKIAHDHYIIVDDSEIQEGDWYLWNSSIIKNHIVPTTEGDMWSNDFHKGKKITHSTQPLDERGYWGKVMPLTLTISEIKELIGEVDVFTVVEQWSKSKEKFVYQYWNKPSFIEGYNQALEDNKEKKYTEEDLKKAIEFGYQLRCNNRPINSGHNWVKDFIAQSLQPKTEWEVEFVDGKLALKK